MKNNYPGKLYIVPTPIGNLSDITQRALITLKNVDLVAVENKRHTGLLLKYFNIKSRLLSINSFNEKKKVNELILKMKNGLKIALVSNAGTPLISDPGYHLVRACHLSNILVEPLPGPCAAVTALSASGLPSNKFCYEGFLPSKSKKRHLVLKSLQTESRTLIFYESTHRLLNSLEDMITFLGEFRYVTLARELTKIWENIYFAPLGKLLKWVKEDQNRCKGEIVIIVEGYKKLKNDIISNDILNTLRLLCKKISLKSAVIITSKIYSIKKNQLYQYILNKQLKEKL